jgi:hypothetical protein
MTERIFRKHTRRTVAVRMLTVWLLFAGSPTSAGNVAEVPVLAAIQANDRGVFNVLLMSWDKKPAPDPLEVRWGNQRIRLKGSGAGALEEALAYAVSRSSNQTPTGTITIFGAAYAPMSSEGPSAGAVLAVGFLAVLRGDPIIRGVAMTGTLERGGLVGHVGAIPDKIRAAVREGYRTILVPDGQMRSPTWNLGELALELNVTIKEVHTIDEAYELLTGRHL